MAVEIVSWIEIPVRDMKRAKQFYENVFQFKIVDLTIGNDVCQCIPNTSGKDSVALWLNMMTQKNKIPALLYI
ncbi:VOC family protein [Niabella ginsengisoli]|uniref:VOC family protein n=1 Tax=Niabella ginsengisoli TaxID=522298 RepID=UPI00374CB5D3